ncbi:MAG: ATP-binding cassette domain-containing protein [Clostridia bacterium]|nr:ATP-binding cassette domain-containing protein [Clostridia bacterium]
MNLSVKSGTFSYNGKQNVFEDINFSIESGNLLAILGPNGAGKTTLLRCITGMLRWSSGMSTLDGENIRNIPEKRLWSRLSYVPQAKSSPSSYTAMEAVLLGRSSRLGVFAQPSKEDIEKAEHVLDSLGVLKLRDKRCHEISGGEYQMILIARALVSDPEVLILDEPESNLEFKNQLIVLDTMSRLAENGIACIFNTHYPEHALQRSDKALILAHGHAEFGSTPQILTEDNIERAFGVKAVIGEIETRHTVVQNVIPLHLSHGTASPDSTSDNTYDSTETLASVTVIFRDYDQSGRINELLHEYGDMIVGRMGMPYRKRGLYIIHTTFDGEESRIRELTHRLSILPDISVKTTYSGD